MKLTSPSYLYCTTCGKQISTGFYPVETDTPDRGIVVRAFMQCPECIEENERQFELEKNDAVRHAIAEYVFLSELSNNTRKKES